MIKEQLVTITKLKMLDESDLVNITMKLAIESCTLEQRINNAIKQIKYLISNCDVSDYQGEKLIQILTGDGDKDVC